MRKMLLMVLTLVLALGSVGWASHNAWAGQKQLKLFIWSEYIDPAIVKNFEKTTGIKVTINTYESNEGMLSKLVAGGDSQYDVIVPSQYFIPVLVHMHLVQKLNHALIPNLKNLKKTFRTSYIDPGNVYSAAYLCGSEGLFYRKDKVQNFKNTWGMVFNPKMNPGPYYLLDDQRPMIGIALRSLGYDFNSTVPAQLKKASDLLRQTKERRDCLGFRGGTGALNDVVAGNAVLAICYNGDAARAIHSNPKVPLGFAIPKQGSELWYDNMCIPDKAPDPVAANKFINYMLSPKVGAENAMYNYYTTPNAAAVPYLKPEFRNDPDINLPEKVLKTLSIVPSLSGKKLQLIDAAWTRAKS